MSTRSSAASRDLDHEYKRSHADQEQSEGSPFLAQSRGNVDFNHAVLFWFLRNLEYKNNGLSQRVIRSLRRISVRLELWGEDVHVSTLNPILDVHGSLKRRVNEFILNIGRSLAKGMNPIPNELQCHVWLLAWVS